VTDVRAEAVPLARDLVAIDSLDPWLAPGVGVAAAVVATPAVG
jgi:hypothetical protein